MNQSNIPNISASNNVIQRGDGGKDLCRVRQLYLEILPNLYSDTNIKHVQADPQEAPTVRQYVQYLSAS
jgi:hypothetical protein